MHLCVAAFCLATFATPAKSQLCRAPHYRWAEKTSTALFASPVRAVTIGTILTQWNLPPIGPGPGYWCAPRVAAERVVYAVTGWLRLADTVKSDGDWHLELTETPTDDVDDCIVVEIPEPKYDARFGQARAALDSLLRSSRIKRHGQIAQPVHIRVIGAAFFDGEHVHGVRHLARAQGHGRCNGSLRALWEIHPVFRVERP
jgi:hypothetical protein